MPFVRYADDVVLHCVSKEEAKQMLKAIDDRLKEVGLILNGEKTQVVYYKDYRRKQEHEQVRFGFLGFSFQPRPVRSKREPATSFTGFTAEISGANQKKIRESIKTSVNWRSTTMQLADIAKALNNKLRGWVNYFGLFGKRRLRQTLLHVDAHLIKWLAHRHKEGYRAAQNRLLSAQRANPCLFYHWQKRYCYNVKEMTRAV